MALVQIPAPSTSSITSLTTGNLSTGTTNVTGISGDYTNLRLIIRNHETQTAQTVINVRANSDTGSIYLSNNQSVTNSSIATSWVFSSASPSTSPRSILVMDLYNYTSSGFKIGSFYAWSWTGSAYYNQFGSLGFYSTSVISSLNILAGGGETFDGGTYELWGIK